MFSVNYTDVIGGVEYDSDEYGNPSLGVREPRKPKPPNRTGGAQAELEFAAEREAEGVCVGCAVNV